MSYFNTTNESGRTLLYNVTAAMKQDEAVLEIMSKHKKLTPSQLHSKYTIATGKRVPLTSLRRSLSNLTKADKLEMTNEKMKGQYGRNEHFWRFK